MLSCEGNGGEPWKTTIGLISLKATLHVQHIFFVHFFAVVLHDYNVKLPEGLFTWGGGPRSSGVGFFCFHALEDTKQKKPTPLDRGPPLHVNRVLVTRFMEEVSYVFFFTFFSLPLIFTLHWWPLAFLILLPPLQDYHVILPTKKCHLCFLSLALDLCRPFSGWVSLACRLLSLFLCLFLALYSKFVDMTINLSSIL